MLRFNKQFVETKAYEPFKTDKFPKKKIAIVTCMDTRLVELLPAALNIHNGDVKMIKNAGAVITDPWDSTMRSILVAIYELGVQEVMIIAHTTCGVQGMDGEEMLHLMQERGVAKESIRLLEHAGIDIKKWLTGFEETERAVRDTVALVRNHPLMPNDVFVSGFIMDTETGELKPITEC